MADDVETTAAGVVWQQWWAARQVLPVGLEPADAAYVEPDLAAADDGRGAWGAPGTFSITQGSPVCFEQVAGRGDQVGVVLPVVGSGLLALVSTPGRAARRGSRRTRRRASRGERSILRRYSRASSLLELERVAGLRPLSTPTTSNPARW